ncbi:multidrug ABC transporter permease [Acrocarpospora phusangensis]|uniref:Multidrug ABC transporter permease n=1 Tax=Acrocarpospora phusangensis TaxID=1070424 RepID=A0A919QD66_9ACTN|nr:ABC transporter ATP-binding protein [Acrocarpospora phusangensis]GIH25215.1 multidrug ABC transporter permease [Acrocarpospora phusangensis]
MALGLAWRSGRVRLALFAAFTVLAAAVPLAVAWLTKAVLDVIERGGATVGGVVALAVALGLCGVCAALLPPGVRYVQDEMRRRVGFAAVDGLFRATERYVGLARFEEPVFLDRLRIALGHGGATPGLLVAAVLGIARTGLVGVGFLASLVVISPGMSVLVVGSAVPVLLAELWLARRRADVMWHIGPYERREIFFQNLLVSVKAAKEIRLFGIAGHLRELMLGERRVADGERRRMDRRELAVQGCTALASALLAGAGLLWVLLGALDGDRSIGDIALFVAGVAGVQGAVTGLVTEIAQAHEQLRLFAHFRAVLTDGSDLPLPARPRPVRPLRQGIELRDVWFRYSPGQEWALRGVSLSVPYGSTVGLVGTNGAGKSTLVKLLCRMYDPERGAILWDGIDLRDLAPDDLRARVGAVFQDFMEYDLTVAENIGLGDLDALTDRSRLVGAARRAGAHTFVAELPRAYDTLLSRIFLDGDGGERGLHLSGGQWQRLALARALLRGDRDLLILDEPGSGLDAEAEHEVHTRLREHRRGRTSVLISHRLSAVREADLLVVLDRGQVAEQGTHDTLMAAGGVYARLFTLQARGYQFAHVEKHLR